jgi:hypothetical protein
MQSRELFISSTFSKSGQLKVIKFLWSAFIALMTNVGIRLTNSLFAKIKIAERASVVAAREK